MDKNSKGTVFIWNTVLCNNVKVLAFDQFNASLLNKSIIYLFQTLTVIAKANLIMLPIILILILPDAKVELFSNNILCNTNLHFSLDEQGAQESSLEVDPPGPSSPG